MGVLNINMYKKFRSTKTTWIYLAELSHDKNFGYEMEALKLLFCMGFLPFKKGGLMDHSLLTLAQTFFAAVNNCVNSMGTTTIAYSKR